MKRDNVKKQTNKSSSKKDSQTEENKHSYITNFQSSEAVIKQLLDKIIILAVRSSQAKEIDTQMGDFCFNNLKFQMTSLFETNFINYTDDLIHEEPPLLWEFIAPPENTWVELPEPGSQEIDRYESSNISYHEIKKDQQLETQTPTISKMNFNDKNLGKKKGNLGKKESEPLSWNNKNVISEVEEKSSMSGFEGELKIENGVIPEYSGIEDKVSESLSITDAEIKKNIDKVSDITNEKDNKENKDNKDIKDKNLENIPQKKEKKIIDNINIKKREEKKENTNIKPSSQTTSLPPIKKKGKNVPIADYPFSDIPGVEEEYNHDNFEPQNVEFLRREREELIQKKIIENKLKESSNKIIKPIEDNERVKKKLIDTNRLTFDSNGNIIHFRPYKLDNLMKDFAITRNTIKGLDHKLETITTTKRRNVVNKEKKEKEVVQEEIIKNEEEKKIKDVNSLSSLNTDRERFIPSGSNFQIMSPNTGVVIKENNQSKEGSREFSKYFQKYSLQDYDKMLNDYVPLQNRTMLHNHLNSSSNNSKYLSTAPNNTKINNSLFHKKSSIISSLDSNNNVNNTEIVNPLLPNEEQSSYFMDKDKSVNNSGAGVGFNMNSNIALNNPLLSSNMNSINFNRYNESNNSLNMDNSIVMKKLGTGSLKLELDSLKDLSSINSEIINLPNKRNNIFGNSYIRNNKTYRNTQQPIKNNVNDFNKKIMITSGWGNDTANMNINEYKDRNNVVYARHITKQQVLRELGSNILSGIKVRLPRDRKVDINNNI